MQSVELLTDLAQEQGMFPLMSESIQGPASWVCTDLAGMFSGLTCVCCLVTWIALSAALAVSLVHMTWSRTVAWLAACRPASRSMGCGIGWRLASTHCLQAHRTVVAQPVRAEAEIDGQQSPGCICACSVTEPHQNLQADATCVGGNRSRSPVHLTSLAYRM